MQVSEENEEYWKNENRLDSLACAWWNERCKVRNTVYALIFNLFLITIQLL